MGCVNPDGSLSPSAWQMLRLMREPHTPEEAAHIAGQPLFKVRASLREMAESGLITAVGEAYKITEAGLTKLA